MCAGRGEEGELEEETDDFFVLDRCRDHEASRKQACVELQQLAAKENAMAREKKTSEEIIEYVSHKVVGRSFLSGSLSLSLSLFLSFSKRGREKQKKKNDPHPIWLPSDPPPFFRCLHCCWTPTLGLSLNCLLISLRFIGSWTRRTFQAPSTSQTPPSPSTSNQNLRSTCATNCGR